MSQTQKTNASSLSWVQNFCTRPKIDVHIVPFPNFLSQTKRSFQFSKFFGAALNAIEIVVWPKKFGMPQNILEHVEGQDIIELSLYIYCT